MNRHADMDSDVPRGGEDEYPAHLRAEFPTRQYLVTVQALVETQVHVTAVDRPQARLNAEAEINRTPLPLADGFRWVPNAFGETWSYSEQSGQVTEIKAGDAA